MKQQTVVGSKDRAAAIAALYPRERELLIGISAGKPAKQIMHEMGVSRGTFEAYRNRLKSKLGLRDAEGVQRYAILWRVSAHLGVNLADLDAAIGEVTVLDSETATAGAAA